MTYARAWSVSVLRGCEPKVPRLAEAAAALTLSLTESELWLDQFPRPRFVENEGNV